MTLFDIIELRKSSLARMGESEIAKARNAGVPAVYMDPSLGPGLIREMPNGSIERFERRHGEIVVLQTFDPSKPE